MYKLSDIVFEGRYYWVVRESDLFKVCERGLTHSVVIGSSVDADKAIRTAKAMELHPRASVRRLG